jgi:predicted dehydrogenase
MTKRLKLAGIGCGGRTRTYLDLAAHKPDLFEVVAAADPNVSRLEQVRILSRNPAFRGFQDDKALLAEEKLADILVIGTQDNYHVAPCLAAMEKGYDILLEKPISPKPEEVLALDAAARRLGRRVMVCHVLRYTPFYEKVKEILASGHIGDLAAIQATEGVGAWHQAHSYVRGHWAVLEKASPMILAKSCHDLDILSWLVDRPCRSVSSFGHLAHFNAAHRPHGAPPRCTDGCPHADTCPYNAHRYLREHKGWLQWVMDGAHSSSDENIVEWLRVSPWGRCVYACDNNVVDRQVVALDFEGDVNATFTMTAFNNGRNIEVMGTRAVLSGGEFVQQTLGCDIVLRFHDGTGEERITLPRLEGGYSGHGGGDAGLVAQLHHEMADVAPENMKSSLARSVESHIMAFAAEQSRRSGQNVCLEDFRAQIEERGGYC